LSLKKNRILVKPVEGFDYSQILNSNSAPVRKIKKLKENSLNLEKLRIEF